MSKANVIDATLKLAAEKPWSDISLTDIAAASGLALADLRREFPSKGAILGAFARMIDEKVMAASANVDLARAPRDRLFEVIMNRFDALAPYRLGLKSIVNGMAPDPAMLTPIFNSQRWTLEAAGLPADGPRGNIRIMGLAALYASVLRTWLDDTDPGLAKTMAELDRALRRGEGLLDPIDRGVSAIERILCIGSKRSKTANEPATQPPVATANTL